ncbi:subunits of heterodimeric actin filament capping protein Capz [Violaceomyces palustris]|uniref:Subunits of heterodimeric actin filament capping protein Capz n=1 Tax=Violaceomyces palustris TaxID=1673888 RepID=A0ACD0P4S6_9BASI|nr:subunits of heterodimeric actin filament capping protein Capz [Violaceomyces palustris]
MSSAQGQSRLDLSLQLLLQSPPGQVSQVYHDLRGILTSPESDPENLSGESTPIDDAALRQAALVALEEYNTSQFVTASLEVEGGKSENVIICAAGQIVGTEEGGRKRYAHPRAAKSFAFDHLKLTTSDPEPLTIDEKAEPIRSAIDAAIQTYVSDHFPDGTSSTFTVGSSPPTQTIAEAKVVEPVVRVDPEEPSGPKGKEGDVAPGEEKEPGDEEAEAGDEQGEGGGKEEPKVEDAPVGDAAETVEKADDAVDAGKDEVQQEPVEKDYKFVTNIVGNRYNLSNFWSGRWRSSYTYDPKLSTLTCSIQVQVHYFENGNVQLNTSKPCAVTLPSPSAEADPKDLAKALAKLVEKHENEYQKALERSYDELSEKAFKALRRLLPVTRQKIDWDKVMNYKLGSELSNV